MKTTASDFKGLAHICVYTRDIEESIAFYRDNLDFRLAYQTVQNPDQEPDGFFPLHFALIEQGSCVIELLQPADLNRVKQDVDGIIEHFALAVENIEAVYERLRKVEDLEFVFPLGTCATLFDKGFNAFLIKGPSGERIEIFQML
jgi:catechol 2,3-dioxygenase-like lactoylglutathione lyase family enzyme